MIPMELELIERLLKALELSNARGEASLQVGKDIAEINQHITSIDRVLRGHENSPGLISRVQALEKTQNLLRVMLGAFAGAFVTLLAAYISRGQHP